MILIHNALQGQSELKENREVYKIVDEVPLFGDCESVECSNKNIIAYITSNMKYPKKARKNKITGMVLVRFVVETDGTVSEANVINDIGGGCGDEALRVVKNMNNLVTKWTPGKMAGKPVAVLYTLPMTFRL